MKRHTPCVSLPGAMGVLEQNRTSWDWLRQRVDAGYTLIEIMIAVAIVSIGVMLAIPAFQQWIAGYELKQITGEVASNLLLGKMAAKNRNATVTATFTKAIDGKITIGFGDNSINPPIGLPASVTGGSLIIVTNLGPPPVEVVTDFATAPAGTLGTIQFSAQGLKMGGGVGNQRVTFFAQGKTNSITVTPSGKVNWCAMATC